MEQDKAILIGKVLMPYATLEQIAVEYGITRPRVQKIFEETGRKYSNIKQGLIDASDKFRCVICGDPLPMSKVNENSRKKKCYCSDECKAIGSSIDVTELAQCLYKKCKKFFFVNRNWKFTEKKKYCCLDHYLAHLNEESKGE